MAQEPKVRFKWVISSPEPHDVTMRNSLEPVDVFVELDVPMEEKYVANFAVLNEHHLKLVKHREAEIKAELSPDAKSPGKSPGPYPEDVILTIEGLRYIVSQLSGSNSTFKPEVEDEEEWDEGETSGDDWDSDSSDEEWDDTEDVDWEDE